MKKALSIILALALMFSVAALAGCGEKDAGTPAPAPAASSDAPAPAPASSDAPAPAAPASSDAPAPAPAPAPEEPAAGNDLPWNPDNIRNQHFILAHGMAAENVVSRCYHEFCEIVRDLSDGKMDIEEKIGGTLVTDTETFDALLDGMVDFIHSMGSYVNEIVIDLSPLTIAGYYGGNNWLEFAFGTKDLVSQIYGDYGVKYLGALYQGTSVIACSRRQITQPSDVAGLAFRGSGRWPMKTIEAWGGAASNIALPQLADAFSKNTVEGVVTGWTIIGGWGIYEVARYLTTTNICEGFAALLMNGDRWAGLNADEQALLTYAGERFMEANYALTIDACQDYLNRVVSEGVNELYELPAADNQTFVELAYGLYPEMVAEGNLGPKGLQLIDILKQFNGIA